MSGPNVFEMLHEAYMKGRGITLSPDEIDILFELLDDQILDANLQHLESAQRRARHHATLAPDEQLMPEPGLAPARRILDGRQRQPAPQRN